MTVTKQPGEIAVGTLKPSHIDADEMHHFYLSHIDVLYIKMTGLMSRFQIWPWFCHTMNHMHVMNVFIHDVCSIYSLNKYNRIH